GSLQPSRVPLWALSQPTRRLRTPPECPYSARLRSDTAIPLRADKASVRHPTALRQRPLGVWYACEGGHKTWPANRTHPSLRREGPASTTSRPVGPTPPHPRRMPRGTILTTLQVHVGNGSIWPRCRFQAADPYQREQFHLRVATVLHFAHARSWKALSPHFLSPRISSENRPEDRFCDDPDKLDART